MSNAAPDAAEFERILLELSKPFDQRLVEQRRGPGGRMLDYLAWHTVADRLNSVAPGWTFKVKSLVPIGDDDFVCHASLTVAGITRENVGAGDGDVDKGAKSAVSDALKRCAILFGCGLELYRDEEQQRWAVARASQARGPVPPGFNPTPHEQVEDILAGRAAAANPLETPVEALKMAIGRTGMTVKDFCQLHGIRRWSDLSDDRVRELIDECNDMAREAAAERV